jgi:periplasmic protein TonB
MKLKKNPFLNPGRNSLLYFQIGLVAMLVFSYFLLETKFYYKEQTFTTLRDNSFVQFEEKIPITIPTQLPPPPPEVVIAPSIIKIIENDNKKIESIIQSTESNQDMVVEIYQKSVVPAQNIIVVKEEPEIEVPFAVIENVPIYPGCEKYSREKQRSCLQDKLMDHIRQHFTYPEAAKIANIQGRVIVTFVIDKEGILKVEFVRGPDRSLEQEAIRIISLVPKMTPGMQRGKPVAMRMSVPLMFKLEKSD